MRTRTFFAAVGLVVLFFVFAYSAWAEWGPFAWVAAAQTAVMKGYSPKLTFLVTLVAFLVPAVILGGWLKDVSRRVLLGIVLLPAAAVLAHLLLTFFFIITGGRTVAGNTFADKVAGASFLPQNFAVSVAEIPSIDRDHIVVVTTGGGTADGGTFYLPFHREVWPKSGVPVLLKTSRAEMDRERDAVSASIRLAPMPFLVRRAWTDQNASYAVIIEDGESVRGTWFVPALFYGVVIAWAAYRALRPSQPPAPADTSANPPSAATPSTP